MPVFLLLSKPHCSLFIVCTKQTSRKGQKIEFKTNTHLPCTRTFGTSKIKTSLTLWTGQLLTKAALLAPSLESAWSALKRSTT